MGWRILAYKDGDRVRLVSRRGRDHTRSFADLAAAVAKLSARTLVLDGEVAIFARQFRSRFQGCVAPDRHQAVVGALGLALICAERTCQAGRFQSSSAPSVPLSPRVERREIGAATHRYADLSRKTEGRLITGARLLIRGSSVRSRDGSPSTPRTSETLHRQERVLALKSWWTQRAAGKEAHRPARPQLRAGDPARGGCSALSW